MLVKELNEIAVKNGTSMKRMRNAINRTIDQGDISIKAQGISWYIFAHHDCVDLAKSSGYSLEQVAGVVAHLSPRMAWKLNIKYAQQVIETGKAPVMRRSLENAQRALTSDNPVETFSNGSLKTRCFYENLIGNSQVVTVDSWAARIAINRPDAEKILNRSGMYHAISHAYKLAARDNDLFPAEAQAIAWCVKRGTHE